MKWIHRKVWQFCLTLMMVSVFFVLLISVGAAGNPSTHIVFSDYSGPVVIPSGVHARVIGSEGPNTLEVSSGAEVECRNFIGANMVILTEATDQFTVYRSGATAYLESFNGTRVKISATSTPQIMIFPNGSHLLIISQEKMMLGSQEISLDPELVLPPFTDVEEPEIPTITLGDSEKLGSKDILPTGDVIVIDQPGNPLHGMEIIVPPGSYNDTRQFQVSSAPIISHTFSEYFNPITPIITVENGNELSSEPLLITIPVNVPENHFAMAFYYNRQEGRLEGLTPVDVGDGYIVSATRRFSDIVVSSISMDQFSGNFDIDSGFRPGYDDWQFTNYGSRLAPGGHCAGQAVSAMWYYYERRLKNSQRPLYGRYDNNDRGYGTLDFWEDDSWGYRLASVVQHELNWSAPTRRILLGYRGHNDHLTWMAFGYAMLTGGPQYIAIASSGSDPAAHAMVVYRMTQDGLYIADPNYPGDVTGAGLRERIIRYRDGRFVPYNSGPNATAISQGGEIAYDLIGYFPLTRWIDWDRVGARWAELETGEGVGADVWPTQEIQVLADGDTLTHLPLTDRYSVTRTDTARASYTAVGGNTVDMTGRLRLRFHPAYNNVDVLVYRGTQFVTSGWSHQFVMLDLQEGENDFGFYFRSSVNNEDLYSNFQRLIVIYNNDDNPEYQCGWEVDYSLLTMHEGYYISEGRGLPMIRYEDAAGIRQGMQTIWYDQAKTQLWSRFCLYDGLTHGIYTAWWENGNKRSEVGYNHGEFHGLYTGWYEDGNKRIEQHYSNGDGFYGPWRQWYETGGKMFERHYQDGSNHGLFVEWYENGNKRLERTYTNGSPTGIAYYWKEDGSCSSIYDHDNRQSIPCP